MNNQSTSISNNGKSSISSQFDINPNIPKESQPIQKIDKSVLNKVPSVQKSSKKEPNGKKNDCVIY